MIHSNKKYLFSESLCSKEIPILISVSVESALLGNGIKTYEKVINMLENKYKSNILDCYKHPEYLTEVLKTFNENVNSKVLESISKGLDDFSMNKDISKFLRKIRK